MANSVKQKNNIPTFTDKRPPVEHIRTYPVSSSGPFYVYIKKRQVSLSLLTLADDINKRYRSVQEIRCHSPVKIRVSFTDRNEANGLVKDKYFREQYHVFVPCNHVEVDGVAYSEDISPSTMKSQGIGKFKDSHLKPTKIKFCRQLSKFSETDNCYVPSPGLRITFHGKVLPDFVQYKNIVMPIRPYFPKVMYCINCTQYGHTKKHCSSSVRCCICMGEHAEADCLEESNSCYRCKQPHDKISNCPKYIAKTKTVKQNLKKMHKQAYIESKKPLPAESITSEQNPIPSHRIVEVPTNTNVCKTTPAISRKQKKSNLSTSSTPAPCGAESVPAGLVSFDQLVDLLCSLFDIGQHWKAFLQLIMPQLKYLMNEIAIKYPLVRAFITI